jgi:nicotinamidase-related amidase
MKAMVAPSVDRGQGMMQALGCNPINSWRVNETHADLIRPARPALPITIDAAPQAVTFDAGRSALIVIDMQNDFCHPDGWLASIGVDIAPARAPIEPLGRVLPAARAAGMPIVWLNWGNRPDKANISPSLLHVYKPTGKGTGLGDRLPDGSFVLQAGSWSAAIVDELATAESDIHVDKYRMSGFWDTPLDSILRNLRVDTLLFAGVNVDQCVLCTLQDANFLGYDCILLSDCSATTSPAFCAEATLYNVKQCFGFVAAGSAVTAALLAA